MSDLIDRKALKDYVSSLSTHPLNEWDTWGVLAAIDKQPTIDAVPVEIIKHYKAMWKSRAQSGHFSDRIANGMMAQAAEIMLNNHEMTKFFTEGNIHG